MHKFGAGHGTYGTSEKVHVGTVDGLQQMELRPTAKSKPYITVEVITPTGDVCEERTKIHDRFWDRILAYKGRIIVAQLDGPDRLEGADLDAARLAHGFRIGRDEMGKGCIEVVDPNSEIAKRRALTAKANKQSRRSKAGRSLTPADLMEMGFGGQGAGNARLEAMFQQLVGRMDGLAQENAQLKAKLAAAMGEAPADEEGK